MTKEELFEKYSIDESHKVWELIDSMMSVEIYRIMHNGNLPPQGDTSIKWLLDFLDKAENDMPWWAKNVMCRKDWGSLYLTAKRLVYTLSEQILNELIISKERNMVKETLRAQYNQAGIWRIVKKTNNGAGGWRMFGSSHGYVTKEECQAKIEKLVADFPDQYQEG